MAPKETDPLLPAYTPSPEIGYHGEHRIQQSEVSYNQWSPTSSNTTTGTWTYKDQDQSEAYGSAQSQQELQNESDDAQQELTTVLSDAMSRIFRTICILIFCVTLFTLVVSLLGGEESDYNPRPPWQQPGHHPSNSSVDSRVHAILTSTPLIDGHDDLAFFLRVTYKNNIHSPKFRSEFENGGMSQNVDLPRLRSGMNGGAFWSAFVVCPPNASHDMSDSNYAVEVAHTVEQIDLLRRLHNVYPDKFSSPSPAASAAAGGSGREQMLQRWRTSGAMFGPISIEGLHQVSPSVPLSTLRHYYDLGVRMATLTWNCHNPFADAAMISEDIQNPPTPANGVFRESEGAITKRGREVIKEMNRLGMIVDISHTSYWAQKAVLGESISRAPVVFSHSSAYSLCPHPRNVLDDILDLVPKAKKSLVMVNFSPDFISCVPKEESKQTNSNTQGEPHFSLPAFYEKNNTLHQVARHIVYIGERIGFDHVGLGSDYDGMSREPPAGLSGVDKFPDLIAELLRMGVSDEDAKKIVGGNILRVWNDVDEVSVKMKAEGVEPGLDSASGY